jgi:hypothetical protein
LGKAWWYFFNHRMSRLLLFFVISLFCSSEIITRRISRVRTNSSEAMT